MDGYSNIKEMLRGFLSWLGHSIPNLLMMIHRALVGFVGDHPQAVVIVLEVALVIVAILNVNTWWKKKFTEKKTTKPELEKLKKTETKTVTKKNDVKIFMLTCMVFGGIVCAFILWLYFMG